jgi:hypothetical protein
MSHYIIKSQFWHDRVNVLKKRGISPLTAIDIGANVGEWYKDFKQIFPHANVLRTPFPRSPKLLPIGKKYI